MKGLFFLYHYSTKTTASGVQNIRFINGLIEKGIDIDIVTISEDPFLKSAPKIVIKSNSPKILNSLLNRIFPDIVNVPDIEVAFWTRKVIQSIGQVIQIEEYDWIHTVGSPQSVHLIGKFIKKHYQIPWIAHFYDPWVDNNFKKFIFKASNKINMALEKKVAEKADIVIHTNEIITEVWKKRYPMHVNKFRCINLCTDQTIKPLTKEYQTSQIRIVHAGAIYDSRNLDLLIDAIKILLAKVPTVRENFVVQLIGYVSAKERRKIISNKLDGIIHLVGKLTYEDVLKYYSNADALLLIDNLVDVNVFFPSKLCEYFSYNMPIIGIVPFQSSAYHHLEKSNHLFVNPSDAVKLSEIIEMIIERKEYLWDRFDNRYYENFLPQKVASDYVNLLNEVMLVKYG